MAAAPKVEVKEIKRTLHDWVIKKLSPDFFLWVSLKRYIKAQPTHPMPPIQDIGS